MAFKIVAAFAFLTIVAAGPADYQGYHQQPAVLKAYTPAVVKAIAPVYKQVEHEAPAEYEFSYAVHDDHTGDIKSQQESRKGDVVHGHYELIEPDGHRRIVEYSADDHSGFNAVVHREDSGIKIPQPAPQVHKIITPATKLSYTAPVAKLSYAAPVTHISKVVAPAGHYSSGQEINHVSFSGPSANYNY